jgi:Acetoacetate decarboxylase (ADC)
MLHGFSVPLTPQGKSALASPPPWHYSSDCLAIEYWADPAAIAALLPPDVTPDEKSRGRAFFWFLDWQFTGSNDEVTDPARYQYREAFVLVEALYERTPINYCPFIFVDNELMIPDVRGEDMHSLAPLRIGLGYRLGMSYSVTDLRILKNYVA